MYVFQGLQRTQSQRRKILPSFEPLSESTESDSDESKKQSPTEETKGRETEKNEGGEEERVRGEKEEEKEGENEGGEEVNSEWEGERENLLTPAPVDIVGGLGPEYEEGEISSSSEIEVTY